MIGWIDRMFGRTAGRLNRVPLTWMLLALVVLVIAYLAMPGRRDGYEDEAVAEKIRKQCQTKSWSKVRREFWLLKDSKYKQACDEGNKWKNLKSKSDSAIYKYCRKHGYSEGMNFAETVRGMSDNQKKATCRTAVRERLEKADLFGKPVTVGCYRGGEKVADVTIDWGSWEDREGHGKWACNTWKYNECGGECETYGKRIEGTTSAGERVVRTYRDEEFVVQNGYYTAGEYDRDRIQDDSITSLTVPRGLKVQAWTNPGFTGDMREYKAGEHSNIGDEFNDKISSLKVIKVKYNES